MLCYEHMRRKILGFTLVELMVVVSVLSILSAVLYVNFNDARAQSRDAERKADLRNIQSALELYNNKYGRYPEGCNGYTSALNQNNWSGQSGTNYACSSGDRYITGVTIDSVYRDFAEFMPVLPKDPRLNGADSGYVYTVNAEGSVYKIMVLNTVEIETVLENNVFARCPNVQSDTSSQCAAVATGPTGASNSIKPPCDNATNFANDYALSGGYANGSTPAAIEYYTDIVRCK